MVLSYKFTESYHRWLWKYHKDIYGLVVLCGHTELVTDFDKYLEWCKTDEAKPYLEGGELYKEPY